jgi:hypothetical protein
VGFFGKSLNIFDNIVSAILTNLPRPLPIRILQRFTFQNCAFIKEVFSPAIFISPTARVHIQGVIGNLRAAAHGRTVSGVGRSLRLGGFILPWRFSNRVGQEAVVTFPLRIVIPSGVKQLVRCQHYFSGRHFAGMSSMSLPIRPEVQALVRIRFLLEAPYPSLGMPRKFLSSFPFEFSSWRTEIA